MKKDAIYFEPSIIGSNMGMIDQEAKSAFNAGAKILHLDVMDGLFVPNLTIGPAIIQSISKTVPKAILDVHLMIYHPENFIEKMVSSGAHEITFHFEATEDHEYLINFIKKCGCKAGIAFKPETDESLMINYIAKVDKILIMTVEPGFGGQKFQPKMLDKVRLLRDFAQKAEIDIDLQVDGGIDNHTANDAIEAGANRLVTGSYFFKQKDRKQAFLDLELCKSRWKFA